MNSANSLDSLVGSGPDPDLDLDLQLDFDVDALGTDNVDFTLFESTPEATTSIQPPIEEEEEAATSRPYHSKRPHKKSRAGCKQCKQRKVKCDEKRPVCRSCTLRKETCVYPTGGPSSSSSSRPGRASSSASKSPRSSRDPSPLPLAHSDNDSGTLVVAEPMFRPAGMSDIVDMKMIWFFTAEACQSFNIEGKRTGPLDTLLRVTIPQLGFQSPFLMQTLMGLSALQLQNSQQDDVPASKVATYRARAFEGYRSAIELARQEDYPALLAGSLLMCALASEMFREPDTKPLYIIDWMVVWRGIGLIVEMITPITITSSGLAALFNRPPIDLNTSQKWIPNNLLFMVQSIKPDDPDFEHQQTYYEVLRYLGSLYQELEIGLSPILDLRVITWFTFIPRPFLALAKEHRPRALIILAHYCAFTKQNRGPWWMLGIGDRQIREICEEVGEAWEHLLRVPRKVMGLTDRKEIVQAIMDNNTWTVPDDDLFSPTTRDPRLKQLRLINNYGLEVLPTEDGWSLMPPPLFLSKLQIADVEEASELAVSGRLMSINGEPVGGPAPSPLLASASQSTPDLSPTAASASPESVQAEMSPDLLSYAPNLDSGEPIQS